MSRQRAFTYIELTIVGAIIAILAAIAVPNFLEAKVRSSVSRSKGEMAIVKLAVEAYRTEHRMYPLNKTPGAPDPYDLKVLTTPIPYLAQLPNDAFTCSDVRGAHHTRPITPIPYRYYNAQQVDPENGLHGAVCENTLGGGYIAALLCGYGPNSTMTAQAAESITIIAPEKKFSLLAYDPTNGTESTGDIYMRLP